MVLVVWRVHGLGYSRFRAEMYVAARVNLNEMLVHAGPLLAHQSIEILTKAIMYLEPEHYYCAEEDDPSKKHMHRF